LLKGSLGKSLVKRELGNIPFIGMCKSSLVERER